MITSVEHCVERTRTKRKKKRKHEASKRRAPGETRIGLEQRHEVIGGRVKADEHRGAAMQRGETRVLASLQLCAAHVSHAN